MGVRRLLRALHRARFVYYDQITDRIYAWLGGTICDIYTPEGDEIDSFLLADASVESIAETDAIQAIEGRARKDRAEGKEE